MKKTLEKTMKTIGAALLFAFLLAPVAALAETDRLTVEDPATSAVKFKVTSDGNVTGASFTGAPTNGAAISIQQGASEASSAVKLNVMDASGVNKFKVTADGRIGLGPNPPAYNVAVTNEGGSTVFNARTYATPVTNRSILVLDRSGGSSSSPTLLNDGDWIGSFQANAYIGSLGFYAAAGVNFLIDGIPILNQRSPGKIIFQTAPSGGAMTDRLTIKSDGSIGVGVSNPSQKLEVNGGVRLNATSASQPACDAAARGTFWVIQGGADDSVQVCVQTGNALGWRVVTTTPAP